MGYLEDVKEAWSNNENYEIVEINLIGNFKSSGILKNRKTGEKIRCKKIQCCGAVADGGHINGRN